MKTSIAFAGTVTQNTCACDECKPTLGKWECSAFLVQPGRADQYLCSAGPFDSEEAATKELDHFIEHVAKRVLSETGLDKTMKKSEKITGPDAEKRARQFINEGNPNLH